MKTDERLVNMEKEWTDMFDVSANINYHRTLFNTCLVDKLKRIKGLMFKKINGIPKAIVPLGTLCLIILSQLALVCLLGNEVS